MSKDQKSTEIINQSGFPLQLAILDLVKTACPNWEVIYTEHAWRNELDNSAGFIDLVLADKNHFSVLVLECKRVLDTSWLFLNDKPQIKKESQAKLWISYVMRQHKTKFFGWSDLRSEPRTYECGFCIVDGQDPKSKPMLERIASELVSATEALANEELPFLPQFGILRTYVSVIVTTANLKVCTLDPASISLTNGKAPNVVAEEVPFVRFRKQFTTRPGVIPQEDGEWWKDLAHGKEHTVFVVNASSLELFLSEWEVIDRSLQNLLENSSV